MTKPPKGIKKQILGGVLFCLGAMTALLASTIGFELDIFYVVIIIIGTCLFLYGAMQNNQHKLTMVSRNVDGLCAEPDATTAAQSHSTDFTACANLINQPTPMKQKISLHGD